MPPKFVVSRLEDGYERLTDDNFISKVKLKSRCGKSERRKKITPGMFY